MAASRQTGVYAVVGLDSYLAEEALERLLEPALGADRTDSLQVLRGEETTWARVIDAARTGSLFVSRRAVVVRNAEALKGSDESVAAYLDDPTPGVTLVLMAPKPDRRKGIWKKIGDKAEIVSAEPLKGRPLRGFVQDRIRRRGVRLSEDGLQELIDRVGQDLRRLMGEVDKLEAFAAGSGTLGADEVSKVLGRGMARPLYRLSDALMARRGALVLELLDEVLEDGEAPQKLLAALHRSLRQVRGARALREARASQQEVISRLGLLPFKVGDVLEASRRWTETELRDAIAALGRADREMKTGADAKVALTAAITRACADRRQAGARGRTGR